MKSEGKFDAWFDRQVGKRPSHQSTVTLMQQARVAEEEGKRLRELIVRVNEWEAQRNVARVAWMAAGGRE
jgi:hypothetical protein